LSLSLSSKILTMTEEEKTSVQEAITQARKEATSLQQQIKKKIEMQQMIQI